MIYTVTLNPALDYVMDVGEVKKGETNRSLSESISFGGKGINVSVILKELGVSSTALGFVAGFTGDKLVTELDKTGINTDFVYLESGMTRINVKLRSDEITEINAGGPEITDGDMLRLIKKLECISNGDTLVLSGSVPKSAPQDIYEKMIGAVSDRAVRLVVDASGKLLLNCLKHRPWLIKPNKSELEELVGRTLTSEDEIVTAAKELQVVGAMNVLVTLGGDGAVLVCENGETFFRKAFKITPKNTVGSGDSTVAGYIVGAEKGGEYALKLASACGAATAASDGLATPKEILSLMQKNC